MRPARFDRYHHTLEAVRRIARQRKALFLDNQRLLRENAMLHRASKGWWVVSLVTLTVCVAVFVGVFAWSTVRFDQVEHDLATMRAERTDQAQFFRAVQELREQAGELGE